MRRFAFLPNPYFVDRMGDPVAPITDVEILFHDLVYAFDSDGFRINRAVSMNLSRQEREQVAKEVQRAFLAEGYVGIETPVMGGEVVVFDPDAVRRITLIPWEVE